MVTNHRTEASRTKIQSYIASDGIVNHFKLLWELRARFPLHFIVFKQVSSHLAHEANVEQYFSRAGLLSDPNMDAYYLGILVMVGTNKSRFKPSLKAILERTIIPSFAAKAE